MIENDIFHKSTSLTGSKMGYKYYWLCAMVKFAYCAIYCDLMLTAGVYIERHRRTRLEPYGMRTN